jgi:hypothetical protein
MTETGRHAYISLTLNEGGEKNYTLLLHDPDRISSSFMHLHKFYLQFLFFQGKFEDNLIKSSTANYGELATDAEVTQKLVTEEMQTLGVTSDVNLNKFAAEGSVPWQEEVIYYIYLRWSLISKCKDLLHFYIVTCRETG